ncbi:MAG: aquaporin [Fimbriimonadaceae bacterium]|nr:aquaporin [Fimbriimonadaceae bacterium]
MNLKAYVAEFIGAFALLFCGVGAAAARSSLSGNVDTNVGIALAHGLAIAVMVGAFGGVSGGHFNPAVSLGVFICKKLKLTDLIAYWVFQIGGAVAAVYLLKQLYGDTPMVNCTFGLPSLAQDVWPIHGIVAEGVMTFFLVIVVLGTAVYKGGIPAAPLMIGLTITAGALAGGALTGAALNPARYLGSALVSGQLGEAHIYLIGTFGGGLLAGLLSRFVVHKEDAPAPAA